MVEKQDKNRTLIEQTKATRWKENQSGNPDGRPPNSVTTLLKNRNPEDNQAVADKLYALALNGDMSAIKEYIDRTDGKVIDKHLYVTVPVTPESIQQAQAILLEATQETKLLLDKYPKRGRG